MNKVCFPAPAKAGWRVSLGLVCLVGAFSAFAERKPLRGPQDRPNIIYIFTDQQSATMMSCTGNQYLKTPAVDYLAENGVRFEKAYYLVLSYINPHDICYFFRTDLGKKHALVEELRAKAEAIPKFYESEQCPPLLPNCEPQPDEPAAYQAMKQITLDNKKNITEDDWRLSRWMYARMTEIVDAEIQVVLDALKKTGQEENTVVIFSSDHGDNEGAYRLHGKSTFNEQSIRIPFIVMDKGGNQKAGTADDAHFVINGLDLLPTVMDYAGVPGAKGDPRGMSVRPLVEGKEVPWRKDLGVESSFGRMVMNDQYKYIEYDVDGIKEERLRDMQNDPHEKTHCTADPDRAGDLTRMKEVFKRWFPNDAVTKSFNKNKRKVDGRKPTRTPREERKKNKSKQAGAGE